MGSTTAVARVLPRNGYTAGRLSSRDRIAHTTWDEVVGRSEAIGVVGEHGTLPLENTANTSPAYIRDRGDYFRHRQLQHTSNLHALAHGDGDGAHDNDGALGANGALSARHNDGRLASTQNLRDDGPATIPCSKSHDRRTPRDDVSARRRTSSQRRAAHTDDVLNKG
ncbi:hypothetical protein D9611_013443 [Ephemerocybe angulata]|uniref:Uncharacterized protein n=1 Tax=Ephemerocybe angulata TaxID=980116 RepID=A0A8H5FAV5_9AGAR|nr:hypothetical protein D9611_013443 [Tulosesus angulatus]